MSVRTIIISECLRLGPVDLSLALHVRFVAYQCDHYGGTSEQASFVQPSTEVSEGVSVIDELMGRSI